VILAAVLLWLVVAAVAGLILWGLAIEPERLEVSRLALPLPRLPEELRDLRIGHISDTHLRGRPRSRRLAERACAALMAERPDLICISGDLANHAEHMQEGVEILPLLSAPLGVFMVLGNHDCDATMEDYLAGNPSCDAAEQAWRRAVAPTGVVLLDNESRTLDVRGRPVVLAGIGDLSAGQDDLPGALAGAPPGDLHLLLCHTPDAVDLPGSSWADLVLVGHTHGGQLQVPGIGSLWAPVWRLRERASGLLRLDRTLLFVNRGVSSAFPARINCRPQVAILELAPGSVEQIRETHRRPQPAWEECAV
jgi:uncharacterized protein